MYFLESAVNIFGRINILKRPTVLYVREIPYRNIFSRAPNFFGWTSQEALAGPGNSDKCLKPAEGKIVITHIERLQTYSQP
jgi:hypothetical protein